MVANSDNPLNIIQIHTHYQHSGGEDQVFAAEYDLLRQYNNVTQFIYRNQDLASKSIFEQFQSTFWNSKTHNDLVKLFENKKIDLIHVHNTFPAMSPSIYYAASIFNVPVIQTLHNYRLLCINALLYRNNKVCEDCVGKTLLPGVIHRCYRNSLPASATVASMLMLHRKLNTWRDKVDVFISLTKFAKAKFIQAGFNSEKIVVKPNFIPDPGPPDNPVEFYALFVGRLTPEKGLETLLRAWRIIGDNLPLKIIGGGSMETHVKAVAATNSSIEYLGYQQPSAVQKFMRRASVLIFPSVCYETFGLTIVEALANGLPVIGSKLGSAGELISHQNTGLHFAAGDHVELAEQVNWFLQHPDVASQMRINARKEYLDKYTPEKNYSQIMSIYNLAIERKKRFASG